MLYEELTKNCTFRCTKQEYDMLNFMSQSIDMSKSDIIRSALRDYLIKGGE